MKWYLIILLLVIPVAIREIWLRRIRSQLCLVKNPSQRLMRRWRKFQCLHCQRIDMNIGYLVLSILRWLLYAPVGVCANIVVWLTCWLLPVFSFFTDDGQLPRCLRWAQTHDNSLDSLWAGSEGAKHRANNSYPWLYQYSNEQIAQSYILRYLARMFWLIRNPAYGFAHDVLGFSDRNAERIYGREYYGGTKYVYDSGRGWWNRYAWTYRRDIPLFGKRYLRIYIGFKAVSTYETSPNLILATHINPFRKQ